jgi:hypothetical protein
LLGCASRRSASRESAQPSSSPNSDLL